MPRNRLKPRGTSRRANRLACVAVDALRVDAGGVEVGWSGSKHLSRHQCRTDAREWEILINFL